ncbi:MAG: DEAD/DEAH box helicase [Bacteroides sp.]|nr:DEAD/DEAH box helicase [Bacteroides sp.]MCM1085847.1 DEAD/DEAH box helicase [Bacteroides sp.]
MPVQAQVLPILLTEETDMVALAQTGTGKTAAFGLPLLQKCDPNQAGVEALVLSPTRELCMQIAKDLKNFGKNIKNLRICAVYGGASIERQLDEIARGVKIVVATPGRMLDIIRRGKIDFSSLRTVVFDEADEMLNMGFRDELDGILENTPEDKHTWLFSATMPKEIRTLANRYMHDPQEVTIGTRNEGSANVTHHYYMVNARQRYLTLKRIIDFYPEIYSIIFCRTRRETQEVAEQLIKDGYNADALHGDLSQAQRDNAMSRFRLKNLQLLVATDVAARGLDVTNLTHVLNYNLPDETEQYVHRSGRTGRASATGISIAIVTPREKGRLREIQKVLKKDFVLQPVPQGEEICEKQLLYQINRMMQLDMGDGAGPIENYLPGIYEKLQDLSKEEIIKRFVWREFNRFSEYYANAPMVEDLSRPDEKKQLRGDSKRGQKGVEEGLTRIFVNLGHMDGLKPQNMLGIINDCIGTNEARIGRIEIYKTCSFVEVDKNYCDDIIDGLNHTVWGDRKLFSEPASGKDEKPSETRKASGARGERRGGRAHADEKPREERYSRAKSRGGRRNNDYEDFDDRKSEWKTSRSGWQSMVDPDEAEYDRGSRGKKRGYDFSAFDRSAFDSPAPKRKSAAGKRASRAVEAARETKTNKRKKK